MVGWLRAVAALVPNRAFTDREPNEGAQLNGEQIMNSPLRKTPLLDRSYRTSRREFLDLLAIEQILAPPPITNDMTIDQMIFNTSSLRAFLDRGPRGTGLA